MKKPTPKHKGKQRSLVTRLREPLNITSMSAEIDTMIQASAKLDAIGEALAYLIEKKHMKQRVKQRGG